MIIDKQALRLAAKNATQGNWKFARSGFNAVVQAPAVLQRGGNALTVVCKLFRSEWRGELKTSQDADFIASANPASVLALLDELEAAEKRIAELEAREVKLPPTFWYEHDDLPREIPVLSRRLVIKALREAGVKVAAAGKGE